MRTCIMVALVGILPAAVAACAAVRPCVPEGAAEQANSWTTFAPVDPDLDDMPPKPGCEHNAAHDAVRKWGQSEALAAIKDPTSTLAYYWEHGGPAKLTVAWVYGPSGRVEQARIEKSSQCNAFATRNVQFEECFLAALGKWTFPSPGPARCGVVWDMEFPSYDPARYAVRPSLKRSTVQYHGLVEKLPDVQQAIADRRAKRYRARVQAEAEEREKLYEYNCRMAPMWAAEEEAERKREEKEQLQRLRAAEKKWPSAQRAAVSTCKSYLQWREAHRRQLRELLLRGRQPTEDPAEVERRKLEQLRLMEKIRAFLDVTGVILELREHPGVRIKLNSVIDGVEDFKLWCRL